MYGSLLLYPDTVVRVKHQNGVKARPRGPISKPITTGSVRADCREEQVLAVCHGNPVGTGAPGRVSQEPSGHRGWSLVCYHLHHSLGSFPSGGI